MVVIDALDESGSPTDRSPLLKAMSTQISNNTLPTNLRFLITARPEDDILTMFVSSDLNLVHKQTREIPEEYVDEDLRRFIHDSLHHLTALETAYPQQEWCQLLVHRSQHLFQWASAACIFIAGKGSTGVPPSRRLKIILEQGQNGGRPLDSLYDTIPGQLFTSSETQQSFRDVMAIVLALQEPLSLMSLSLLFEAQEEWNFNQWSACSRSII